MTEAEKIATLRTMLDGNDESDGVLSVYLKMAEGRVLNRMYPYKTDYAGLVVPDRYAWVQLKVAAYMMNKRGAEGEVQHIENGIHRNYGDADIPEQMLSDIAPMIGVVR